MERTVSGLGGYAYALSVSPSGAPFCLAIGCGDRSIRLNPFPEPIPDPTSPSASPSSAPPSGFGCSSSGGPSRQEAVLLWQGIPDKVTAVAWHPHIPCLLAFGCQDGTLGIFDTTAQQSALLSVRHRAPVLELAWRPEAPLTRSVTASSAAAPADLPPPAACPEPAPSPDPSPEPPSDADPDPSSKRGAVPNIAVVPGIAPGHAPERSSGAAGTGSDAERWRRPETPAPREPTGGDPDAAAPDLTLLSLCGEGRVLQWSLPRSAATAQQWPRPVKGAGGPAQLPAKPADIKATLLGLVDAAVAPGAPGHAQGSCQLTALGWSPDGAYLAVGLGDGRVHILGAGLGSGGVLEWRPLRGYASQRGAVNQLCWRPARLGVEHLAAAGDDGSLAVYTNPTRCSFCQVCPCVVPALVSACRFSGYSGFQCF